MTTSAPFLTHLRDDLQERRQRRRERRDLARELASYSVASEVYDLIDSLQGQDGPEADQIRTILAGNLARGAHHQRTLFAS